MLSARSIIPEENETTWFTQTARNHAKKTLILVRDKKDNCYGFFHVTFLLPLQSWLLTDGKKDCFTNTVPDPDFEMGGGGRWGGHPDSDIRAGESPINIWVLKLFLVI